MTLTLALFRPRWAMRDREFRVIDAVVGVVLVAVLVIAAFVASTASAAITEITVAAAPAVTTCWRGDL